MSNKKNIDRLFQEKFKDFEAEPNDAVWSRISDTLAGKKKKRRVVPIWWQLGGVAAVIALLLTVGISVFNSERNSIEDLPIVNTDKDATNSDSNSIVNDKNSVNGLKNDLDSNNSTVVDSDSNSEENTNLSNTKDNTIQKEKKYNSVTTANSSESQSNNAVANNSTKNKNTISQKPNALPSNSDKENTKIAANTESSNSISEKTDADNAITKDKLKSEVEKSTNDAKNAVVDKPSLNDSASKKSNAEGVAATAIKSTKSIIEDLDTKQSIEDAIAENTKDITEKEEEKEEELNRWSIAPNVAPVYYSSLGKGSSIDQQFNENSKSGAINMSYGIVGSYAVSKKIKVRTGVNRVNLSRTTSDVFSFNRPTASARSVNAQFSNITFKDGVQNVSLVSTASLNLASTPETFNTSNTGNIDQRLGFIEVPLEIEYRLLDNKFGVNVIGGFSTFFLNGNEIFTDIDGNSTFIGEANNINSTSFSANFGLGMDYSLSKKWNINLEPTFKYQINTFNNTSGNFRPFFIGVYTGLSFKF